MFVKWINLGNLDNFNAHQNGLNLYSPFIVSIHYQTIFRENVDWWSGQTIYDSVSWVYCLHTVAVCFHANAFLHIHYSSCLHVQFDTTEGVVDTWWGKRKGIDRWGEGEGREKGSDVIDDDPLRSSSRKSLIVVVVVVHLRRLRLKLSFRERACAATKR